MDRGNRDVALYLLARPPTYHAELARVWNHLSVHIELVSSDEQLEGASVGMHFQIMTWLV